MEERLVPGARRGHRLRPRRSRLHPQHLVRVRQALQPAGAGEGGTPSEAVAGCAPSHSRKPSPRWGWTLYSLAQGTMFWALFVVGHDWCACVGSHALRTYVWQPLTPSAPSCSSGHRSFSSNNTLNDFVGNIVHSSILVPYHGWRVSHRTHHSNHGHVENDESWHPTSKSLFDKFDGVAKAGRLTLPWAMLAYPFYLFNRSPGKVGSHFDPSCDLFVPSEKTMVLTSNACLVGMLGVLTAGAVALGPLAMAQLYLIPYLIGVAWLDLVTYLHHHGPDEAHADMPWYRGAEWSYLRGGLTTLDRDFGVFNKLHHNIETHVVHHLFPQIPHYHLVEATKAVKPVLGDYYREPQKSGFFPFHIFQVRVFYGVGPGRCAHASSSLEQNLTKSFARDHYVADTGDVVYYQKAW